MTYGWHSYEQWERVKQSNVHELDFYIAFHLAHAFYSNWVFFSCYEGWTVEPCCKGKKETTPCSD